MIDDNDQTELPSDITSWTNLQDQGGLLQINVGFYTFIKVAECCLRSVWNVKVFPQYKNKDALIILMANLKSLASVQHSWKELIGDAIVNESFSEALLEDVLQKWISMRIKQVKKCTYL